MFPWIYEHILIVLSLSPLLGVVFLVFLPKRHERGASEITAAATSLTLFLALIVFAAFKGAGRFELTDSMKLLNGTVISCGVDGLSMLLVVLVSTSFFILSILSWRQIRRKEIFAAVLVMESASLFFYSAMDIYLLYTAMEIAVIAAIIVLSSSGRKLWMTIGFIAFSALIFLVTVIMLATSSSDSLLSTIETVTIIGKAQIVLLSLLLIGSLARMGVFPFHGWIREVREGARGYLFFTIVGMVIIATSYFLYRMIVPFAMALAVIKVPVAWMISISILITATMALTRKNIGDLMVLVIMIYSSFIFLGVTSMTKLGMAGAGMQMVALMISAVSVAVIFALFERKKIDLMEAEYRGAFGRTPLFALFFFIFVLSLTGIPGLSHFPGLFMVWMGLFKANWMLVLILLLSTVFLGTSLVRMLSEALFSGDAPPREGLYFKWGSMLTLVPFVLLMVMLGIFPDIVLKFIKLSTEAAWQVLTQQI